MNDTSNTDLITLESLQKQKAEAREELRAQKKIMNDTARNLFAPLAPAADRGTAIMRAFNTGMAVFRWSYAGNEVDEENKKFIPVTKKRLNSTFAHRLQPLPNKKSSFFRQPSPDRLLHLQ